MKPTKVEIDVTDNKIYVVKNGEVTPLNPPATGFGEQIITWQGGKLIVYQLQSLKKLNNWGCDYEAINY